MTENTDKQRDLSLENAETQETGTSQNVEKNEIDQNISDTGSRDGYENVFPLKRDDPDWERKKAYLRSNLSDAFRMLVPGMSVSVTRMRPAWCARWIETVPVDVNEEGIPNIDLDFLKESYGGDQLSLRFLDEQGKFIFGTSVNFRGVEPREAGIPLEHPEIKRSRELREQKELERAKEERTNNNNMFSQILDMQNQNFNNMLSLIQQKNESKSPFSQMEEVFLAMDRLEKMRGKSQPAVDTDSISGMLSGLAQMFMAKGAAGMEQQSHAPRQFGPPPQARSPQQRIPRTPMAAMPVETPPQNTAQETTAQRAPQPATKEPVEPDLFIEESEEEGPDIVDELAEMDNDELAETVNCLLDQLGPERTQAIFQRLGSILQKQADGPTENE